MPLLDDIRKVLRRKHYSYRTEQCYVRWIMHYLRFHKGAGEWRHPNTLSAIDVESFLTHLAMDRHVSASTQNQDVGWVEALRNPPLRFPFLAKKGGFRKAATHPTKTATPHSRFVFI